MRAVVSTSFSRSELPPASTVAVVEDDAPTRKSMLRLLEANGFTTQGFSGAERFLEGCKLNEVFALVLDINLGGMSGIELGRALRSVGSRVPIIYVTARDEASLRVEALRLGCVAYLLKPFAAEELTQALSRCRQA